MKKQDWFEMKVSEVKHEYLNMPQSFSDRVDQCVREQLEDEDTNREKKIIPMRENGHKSRRSIFKWTKAAACAVIAVFVIGGTAMAATHFHLTDLIFGNEITEDYLKTGDEIEQLVASELPEVLSWVDTSGETDFKQQLLEIREVYFDGSWLYVYGEATEAGKAYDLYSSRFIINGQQYETDFSALASSEHYFQGDDKPEENAPDAVKDMYELWMSMDKTDIDRYFGAVQLTDLELTGDFTVELPLSVYPKTEGKVCLWTDGDGNTVQREYRSDGTCIDDTGEYFHDLEYQFRYNNLEDSDLSKVGMQTISFNVSVTDNRARITEPQWIDVDGGRVWVEQLTVAPDTAFMKFRWYMEGADAKEKIQELSKATLKIMDENGNEYQWSGSRMGGTLAKTPVFEDTDSVWYTEKQMYIVNVPMNVKTLTITPLETETDQEDVKIIEGGVLDYASFAVTVE